MSTYSALLDRIGALDVIDTHEHMTNEADFLAGTYDFTRLMSYVGLDIGLAGLRSEPWGRSQWEVRAGDSVEDKWNRLAPLWKLVRTGCYARAYRRMLKMFFDVDDLDERTVHLVSERIKDYQRPGVYDEYLHGAQKIHVMIRPENYTPIAEPQHFALSLYIDDVAGAWSAQSARDGLDDDLPPSFGEFREKLIAHVDRAASNGAVGMKMGWTCRTRPLDFVKHHDESVEESYRYLIDKCDADWRTPANRSALKPYQDTCYRIVFGRAGELGLPVQVHSGLEFMQPWDGRPTSLIPSLVEFPDTKFVIFHGSYPHMHELTGLAKSFHNVYLDLAWFHLLSRYQARAWLAEWLDVLPHNKIFAFGGDVFLFFEACSHLEVARENIAAVLAQRVDDGLCDLDDAEHTARLLFHDNPWNTFKFENWRSASVGS